MGDNDYYVQVSESIKSIYELTTRIDERMKTIIAKQEQAERKIDAQVTLHNDLNTKVKILESHRDDCASQEDVAKVRETCILFDNRLQKIETLNNSSESRWKTVLNLILQMAWVLLTSYLVYRLGLQPPVSSIP